MAGRPTASGRMVSKPTFLEYFESPSFKKIFEGLREKRPLIFVLVDRQGYVKNVIIREEKKVAEELPPIPTPTEPMEPFVEPEVIQENPVPEPAALPEPVAPAEPSTGEVKPGRWVEFRMNEKLFQGKISWISDDEQEFLIKTKEGKSIVVSPPDLVALLPDAPELPDAA